MTAAALESIVSAAPRLGLTFPADPYTSTSWSGTPAGLIAGLRACGVAASGFGLHLPLVLHKTVLGTSALVRLRPWSRGAHNVLHEALTRAHVAPSQGRLETFLARRRLRGPRRFDAIVQLGTGYSLPSAATVVTLEDMTVPLARHFGSRATAICRRGLSRRAAPRKRGRMPTRSPAAQRVPGLLSQSSWITAFRVTGFMSSASEPTTCPERSNVTGAGRGFSSSARIGT